jgi:hypothetical protein
VRQAVEGVLAALASEGDVVPLGARLNAAGVSCTIPDGHLRFSPHWPNDPGEVPFVLDAIDDALREE